MTIAVTTPARVPFTRIPPATFIDADRELQKVERFTAGLFQPRVITHALSPYAVQSTDTHLVCDATDGVITLTFPAAARVNGLEVTCTKTDASANAVMLSGTFSGAVNPTLAAQYKSKTIKAGNGVYYVTASV